TPDNRKRGRTGWWLDSLERPLGPVGVDEFPLRADARVVVALRGSADRSASASSGCTASGRKQLAASPDCARLPRRPGRWRIVGPSRLFAGKWRRTDLAVLRHSRSCSTARGRRGAGNRIAGRIKGRGASATVDIRVTIRWAVALVMVAAVQ